MGMLSRIVARFRLAGKALLRSEEHLAAIARATEQVLRSVEVSDQSKSIIPSNAPRNLASSLAGVEKHLGFIAGIMARREMVAIMADARFADPLRLEHSGFKVHSQYDEDGIISEIFGRIGTTSRTFVEFGCGSGTENCTGFLLMQGWRGLWIDGNKDYWLYIEAAWRRELEAGQLVFRNAFVTVDTIDEIIRGAGFGGEIDFLAVDLDGNDYHALEKISAVSPRVICAEYNANIPPHVDWTMARNDDHVWDGLDYRTGASLKALENLLSARGYALVGCSVAGVNAFFVRKDLAEGKFAEPFTAENHYHPWRSFYSVSAPVTNWRGWRS